MKQIIDAAYISMDVRNDKCGPRLSGPHICILEGQGTLWDGKWRRSSKLEIDACPHRTSSGREYRHHKNSSGRTGMAPGQDLGPRVRYIGR